MKKEALCCVELIIVKHLLGETQKLFGKNNGRPSD